MKNYYFSKIIVVFQDICPVWGSTCKVIRDPLKINLTIHIIRGEIWLVALDPALGKEIKKTRPAIVISNNKNNEFAGTITVIPVTSNIKNIYPFDLLLNKDESGLLKDSKAKCNQIRTIDKSRLIKQIGVLSLKLEGDIGKPILIHLGLY